MLAVAISGLNQGIARTLFCSFKFTGSIQVDALAIVEVPSSDIDLAKVSSSQGLAYNSWAFHTSPNLKIEVRIHQLCLDEDGETIEIGDGADVVESTRLALFSGNTLPRYHVQTVGSRAWIKINYPDMNIPPRLNMTVTAIKASGKMIYLNIRVL